ncbi:hypothetical protein QJS10_CPA10g00399 [Acorus calamus]|uniref:Uncharacterized protein n=1 Tax=Acorus calamus TaxID=4465 RepID=A0AAV9DC57_ACOCL|nr:hypothetical protein QJS10_CPB14g00818 [Acorus calamus]KAK1306664.1 hypothetical protein QJS10_CPA10g00399 [Acorus calamus]
MKHPMSKFTWTTAKEDDIGKTMPRSFTTKLSRCSNGKDDDMQTLLKKELKSGDLAGLHHERLTDTCPFSWGPVVGGEGVRTGHSLPNVGKTIGAVKALILHGYVRLIKELYAYAEIVLNLLLILQEFLPLLKDDCQRAYK